MTYLTPDVPPDPIRNQFDQFTGQNNDEIDLGELLNVLIDSKKVIIVITLIVTS